MTTIVDNPKVTGKVTIQHFDSEGKLLSEHTVNNLVVSTGLQHIAARLADTGQPTQMTHMALGSSSVAPTNADSDLGAQLGRVALNVAGGTPSSNNITYMAVFPVGTATGAISEAGIFNAATGGTMLCRTTFPVINKGSADSLAVTWVVTVS
jgi:hypothetical protein